jgi:hypothetical protein
VAFAKAHRAKVAKDASLSSRRAPSSSPDVPARAGVEDAVSDAVAASTAHSSDLPAFRAAPLPPLHPSRASRRASSVAQAALVPLPGVDSDAPLVSDDDEPDAFTSPDAKASDAPTDEEEGADMDEGEAGDESQGRIQ